MKAVITALMLSLALSAAAQNGATPSSGEADAQAKQAAQVRARQLKNQLSLTDEQAAKVESALESGAKREAVWRRKLADATRATHQSVRSVLNENQKHQYDVLHAQDVIQRWGPSAPGPGAPAAAAGPAPGAPGEAGPQPPQAPTSQPPQLPPPDVE